MTGPDRWWPGPFYEVHLEVEVFDFDGVADVESVFAEIPTFGFQTELHYNPDQNRYEKTISEDDLAPTTVSELVGYPVYFTAVDLLGNYGQSAPYYLTRVIKNIPVPISPLDESSAEPQPTLVWIPFDYQFPIWQRVNVYRNVNSISIPAWQVDSLSAELNTIEVGTILDPGTYYWTITVRDAFGNLARSKEAPFIIP